jgi:hypothetical protein
MYEKNPYYNPEGLDLSPVGELEYSDGDYQFDTRVVWKHDSGRLYTARDAGCSCPTPFEDYCDLALLETVDYKALEAEVKSELSPGDRYSTPISTPADGQAFLAKVKDAM